jgi:subtilisin family serine protease
VGKHRPLAALLAAILLGLLTAVPGNPVAIDSAFAAAPAGRLVVTWKGDAPAALGHGGVDHVQRSHVNRHRSVVVARAGEATAVAARLQNDPRVVSVVPDAVGAVADWPAAQSEPADPLWADDQFDMRLIGLPEAWTVSIGSADVVVAVLDTGYEASHEDLVSVPIASQYNARTGTQSITDGYGHGTHVAGTIAAGTNNALGVASMAPGVTIMPVKILDSNGYGYWSDFLEGVDWARTHGASVINMSLGSGLSSSQIAAFQPTFTAAWNAGIVIVAAAGNNNNNTPFYPASFANVISVSASNNSDTKAGFSNFGPNVDLAAPGVGITSTYVGNTYKVMGGTSMATPHVAGLAALIRSVHPEFSPAEVETAMKATAKDLGAAGRDDVFGYGRIRAPRALAWLPPDIIPPLATLMTPTAGTSSASEFVLPKVAFDEPVNGVDATTVTLTDGAGNPVAATLTYDSLLNRATLAPATRLASRTTYRVVVGGAITDLANNLITPTTFTFKTTDSIRPQVIRKRPVPGSTGVWRRVTIKITFSEPVKGVSVDTLRLRDVRTGKRVALRLHYDAATRTAYIDPIYRLAELRWYRVRIRDGIRDLGGNTLAPEAWRFKTR